MGAHQKIDRVARRQLGKIIPKRRFFPDTKAILHFEGKNGPDGIKRKSPSRDEPWHYIDPTNHDDTQLLEYIADHSTNLARALADKNDVRAAFEAAWLAHAIVDGLTPAHHYPLADKIEELWGKPKDERLTVMEKNIIRGENKRDTVSKNWEYWGAKGVFTTHFMFEFGFASTISPMRFTGLMPDGNQLVRLEKEGFITLYKEAVLRVYGLDMYQTFHKHGWTNQLAKMTRTTLAPIIIEMVILAWYEASQKAAR